MAENTIVVYASDQGFYLGEHGWYDKRWMYEESFRTPLIIRWPGAVEPQSVNRDLVQNLDWAPTLLEMAGVEVPSDMQGRSLVPLLKNGEAGDDWRDSLYYHYYETGVHGIARHYGVATDRYKLIYYYDTDEWEMFDLEKDKHEVHSVYGDAEYAAVQARLKRELIALREQYKDDTGKSFTLE